MVEGIRGQSVDEQSMNRCVSRTVGAHQYRKCSHTTYDKDIEESRAISHTMSVVDPLLERGSGLFLTSSGRMDSKAARTVCMCLLVRVAP